MDKRNVCKILFVGDTGVGKTSIIKRIVYNKFEYNNILPTMGVGHSIKSVSSRN